MNTTSRIFKEEAGLVQFDQELHVSEVGLAGLKSYAATVCKKIGNRDTEFQAQSNHIKEGYLNNDIFQPASGGIAIYRTQKIRIRFGETGLVLKILIQHG